MVSDEISSRRLNGMKTIKKIPGHWESLFFCKMIRREDRGQEAEE